jgi:hypothetical protein
MASDMTMRHELATVAEFDIGTDDAIGPDRCVVTDHRPRFDRGGWIDCAMPTSRNHGADFGLGDRLPRDLPSPRTTTCSFFERFFSRGTRSCRPAPLAAELGLSIVQK